MADKVDKLLEDYYSGVIVRDIAARKRELQDTHEIDENVGGGRAQNKQSRNLDNMLIRQESDPIIKGLHNDLLLVREAEKTWDRLIISVVRLHYDRRVEYNMTGIAQKLHISERQCYRYVNWVRKDLQNTLWKTRSTF